MLVRFNFCGLQLNLWRRIIFKLSILLLLLLLLLPKKKQS